MQNSKLHQAEPAQRTKQKKMSLLAPPLKTKTDTKPVPMLFMRMITWQRDSHGLFDYESRQLDKFEYKTTSIGYITRKNAVAGNEDPNAVAAVINFETSSADAMAQITVDEEGNYCLNQVGTDEGQLIWKVVSRPPDIEYESPSLQDLVSIDCQKSF